MALSDTLARVQEDLAAGRIPVARQRLRGLVTSFPADLTVRRQLAQIYRLYGDPAEAGRWSYLEEDRDPQEASAFEKRYRTPARRMKALAWHGPESLAGSEFAVQELEAVRAACTNALGRPVDWESIPTPGDDPQGSALARFAGCAGCLMAVVVFLAIWVNGLIALFD